MNTLIYENLTNIYVKKFSEREEWERVCVCVCSAVSVMPFPWDFLIIIFFFDFYLLHKKLHVFWELNLWI